MRTIIINPVLNGYLVECGCQRLVFPGREHLLQALREYLTDPKSTEKRYLENAVNPMQAPEIPVGDTARTPRPTCATQMVYRDPAPTTNRDLAMAS